MSAPGQAAGQAARDTRDHPVLDRLARAGFVAYGVVHVLIAWLAAHLAFGNSEGSASGQGALEEIAQKPLGATLLWLVAAGLAALAVWQACQAVGGHRDCDGAKRWVRRGGSASRAVVMGLLSVLSVRTALGDAGGGFGGGGGSTGALMRQPYGEVLVLLAAAVVALVAVLSARRGLGDGWRRDVEVEGRTGHTGSVVEVLARSGYVSRAVAFAVISVLLVRAAIEERPRDAGLDQAIVRLRDEPMGPWLILVVAIGLGCFGLHHVARAWYLRAD